MDSISIILFLLAFHMAGEEKSIHEGAAPGLFPYFMGNSAGAVSSADFSLKKNRRIKS